MMHPSELFKRITMPKSNFFRHIGKHLSYKFHKVRKDKTIYVCFQGSNGMTDWLHNFLFKPRRMETYKGCGWFVHAGFARVWRSGSDTVMKELRKLHERLPGFKIVFCGFSHGGPLAMLAAKNGTTSPDSVASASSLAARNSRGAMLPGGYSVMP